MNKIRVLVSVVALSIALLGCSNSPNSASTSSAGKSPISLQYAGVAAKLIATDTTIQAPVIDSADIKIGNLYASHSYNFILVNNGTSEIKNLKIKSSRDTAFIVTPDSIFTVAAPNKATGLISTLTLGIEHGINLVGAGYVPLLPIGLNYDTLTFTGTTADTAFSVSYVVSVNAIGYNTPLINDTTSGNGEPLACIYSSPRLEYGKSHYYDQNYGQWFTKNDTINSNIMKNGKYCFRAYQVLGNCPAVDQYGVAVEQGDTIRLDSLYYTISPTGHTSTVPDTSSFGSNVAWGYTLYYENSRILTYDKNCLGFNMESTVMF